MTFRARLGEASARHDSLLCVGLDPDPAKFPGAWRGDAGRIFEFCVRIAEATHDLVLAFKPQIAYFAAHRAEGQLERLIDRLREIAPQVPVILDAKRGGIGATAEQYAREELTTRPVPSAVLALRTTASASPPCAPTPGISSGSVGASSRTRASSAG